LSGRAGFTEVSHWMLEAPKAPAECTAGAQAIKQNRKSHGGGAMREFQ